MVTYQFYKETYGGTLDMATFRQLARQAENYINYQTFNRLKGYEDTDDRVKFLVCDMITLIHSDTDNKEISSLSTNGESVSFNVAQAKTLTERQEALSRPILSMIFIDGIRSNYRGL